MIHNEIWASRTAADGTWLSLDDDGIFWRKRALPPAAGATGEVGTRLPRTDGVGVKLSSDELQALRFAVVQAWALAVKREASSK